MPVETRPPDAYTRDNLLLGFSIIEFQRKLASGGYDVPVPIGILSGETLAKTVETLKLERGEAGLLTVDREIVSKFEATLGLECFNFRADLAQYIFGSSSLTAVVADAAAAVVDDPIRLPASAAYDTFIPLSHAGINEASVAVQCGPITVEAVGTGNGVLGGTQGDFALRYKIKVIADVTAFTVGGVDKFAALVAGSTPAAGEIAIEEGKEDSLVTGSGAITFGASEIPPVGAAIVATYTPSFSTAGTDFVTLVDFVFDPVLGRIRFLDKAAADNQPFRTPASAANEQPLVVDYTYVRKASNTLKPFTQPQFEGKATVRHLPDVGVNFIWDIPSVTLRLTDDDLTFGADDFAVASLQLNVNDAGGTDRFGTLAWSSESEAAA